MVEGTRILLTKDELREEMGRNGRSYVERDHDAANITGQYVRLFNAIG